MRHRLLFEKRFDVVLGEDLVDHCIFQRFRWFIIGVEPDAFFLHYLRDGRATTGLLDCAHLGDLDFHTGAPIEAHNVLGVDEVGFRVSIDACLAFCFELIHAELR